MKFKRKKLNLKVVDVEAVLRDLGIEYRRQEDELYASCPNPAHVDKNPSWHIKARLGDERNGVFNCWSCHWSGNLFQLVRIVKGIAFSEAVRYVDRSRRVLTELVQEATDDDYNNNLYSDEPPEIRLVWNHQSIVTRPIEVDNGKRPLHAAKKYLSDRFIGMMYVERFGLVDWPEKQRIIVPITRYGKMISWVARSYSGQHPKTLAPENAPKKKELFNFDSLLFDYPLITVAEGWADVIRLLQIGRPNVVGICGSKISEFQADIISRFPHIEIWMDGDKAGEVMAEDVAAWVGRNRKLQIVPLPKGTDPGHFPPWDLVEFCPIDWTTYKRRRSR